MKFRIIFILMLCCASLMTLVDFLQIRDSLEDTLSLPMSWILNVHVRKMADICKCLCGYCVASVVILLYERFFQHREGFCLCNFFVNVAFNVFDVLLCIVSIVLFLYSACIP